MVNNNSRKLPCSYKINKTNVNTFQGTFVCLHPTLVHITLIVVVMVLLTLCNDPSLVHFPVSTISGGGGGGWALGLGEN